jgi:integrase
LVLGALLGGLRRGELLALEWSDMMYPQLAIHVTKSISLVEKGEAREKGTKNNEDRIVEMPEWYMKLLKLYERNWRKNKMNSDIPWRGGDREYLFHNGTGKPLYHTTPSAWWKEFVAENNLKYIRFHDLRHSSATLLIEAGKPLKAIQERLGHKQHQTTADIYAHVTKKVSRDLADSFDHFDPEKKPARKISSTIRQQR